MRDGGECIVGPAVRAFPAREVNLWVLEGPLEPSFTTDRDITTHSINVPHPGLLPENMHMDILPRFGHEGVFPERCLCPRQTESGPGSTRSCCGLIRVTPD